MPTIAIATNTLSVHKPSSPTAAARKLFIWLALVESVVVELVAAVVAATVSMVDEAISVEAAVAASVGGVVAVVVVFVLIPKKFRTLFMICGIIPVAFVLVVVAVVVVAEAAIVAPSLCATKIT